MNIPAHVQLSRVVRALVARAPEAWPTLLAAPRFAAARPLLERLARPDAAVAGLAEPEAAHLAAALLAAWARLEPVVLPPEAGIVGPRAVWSVASHVRFEVVVDGLVDGWEVEWDDGATTAVVAHVVTGELVRCTARVVGRTAAGARVVLRPTVEARVRRPVVWAAEDGSVVLLRDDTGQPGVGANIQVGEHELVTGADGRAAVPPGSAGAPIRLEGVPIGRLGDDARP
ncbi:MAG: hypothetical protein V4850_08610 [Myxococcota bacterium]